MNGLVALTIIMVVYAAGDMIATKTKAIISMLFVASVVFAIGFWNGLPGTIFADSQLQTFASVTVGLLLVHMGTTIKVKVVHGDLLGLLQPSSCFWDREKVFTGLSTVSTVFIWVCLRSFDLSGS